MSTSLYGKLLDMQRRVDGIIKDGKNSSDKYDFASDENVLDKFRPMMDELGLLLIPKVTGHAIHEGTTKSGTTRFMTEIDYDMVWHDVDSGEELSVPSYAQGVDLAGEKGVGKAATYNEKYFLLKFFHVPTKKDDPDSDGRTGTGEKKQRGTQAGKETEDYMRAAVVQIITEVYGADKLKAALIANTKNESRQYAGVDSIEAVSKSALPVLYGKLKAAYAKKAGHDFTLKTEEENGAV